MNALKTFIKYFWKEVLNFEDWAWLINCFNKFGAVATHVNLMLWLMETYGNFLVDANGC